MEFLNEMLKKISEYWNPGTCYEEIFEDIFFLMRKQLEKIWLDNHFWAFFYKSLGDLVDETKIGVRLSAILRFLKSK